MRLGDMANEDAAQYGKPLDGVRVLALEQMQALPYATQLLARLGADVVKIEAPDRRVGARFAAGDDRPDGPLRSARPSCATTSTSAASPSTSRTDAGRDLFLALAPHFDVFAENFKAGTMDRMGLGYDAVAAVHPSVDLRVGVGLRRQRLAVRRLAGVRVDRRGDVGHLRVRARRRRDAARRTRSARSATSAPGSSRRSASSPRSATATRTGEGQHVDIAMYDATVAMTDIVTNFGSLGRAPAQRAAGTLILDPFRASDGWFVMQLVREHQFERSRELVGHPEWLDDPRLATRDGLGRAPRGHAPAARSRSGRRT